MFLAFQSMSFQFNPLLATFSEQLSNFFADFLRHRAAVSDGFGPDGMTKVWLPIVSRCPPFSLCGALGNKELSRTLGTFWAERIFFATDYLRLANIFPKFQENTRMS